MIVSPFQFPFVNIWKFYHVQRCRSTVFFLLFPAQRFVGINKDGPMVHPRRGVKKYGLFIKTTLNDSF